MTRTSASRGGGGASTQPLDAELTAIAGLVSAADRLPYFTGSGTASLTTLSGFARTFLDDSDAATVRATLGAGTGSGSVTSVGLSLPTELTVSGSPVTASGTLTGAWASQSINRVFAAPSGGSGTPAFRLLVAGDIPDLSATYSIVSHTHTFASLTSKPTTLVGYGITDAQSLDAELTAIAGLTSAADRLPYFTGSGTASLATFSAFARTILDDADAATVRATIGAGTGVGSVTSVGLSLPAELTVSGSPVTTAGTLTGVWASQTANKVLAAPSGGAGTPTFRVLTAADLASHDHSSATTGGGTLAPTAFSCLDNAFTLKDNLDPTKQAQFQLSNGLTATTRTYMFMTTTLGVGGTIPILESDNVWGGQNLFGATVEVLDGSNFKILDSSDSTKAVTFECATVATGTTRQFTFPNFSGVLVATGRGSDPPVVSGDVAIVNRTGRTANITPAVFFTLTPAAGFYLVTTYLACTTAGSGTIVINFNYTDDSGLRTNQNFGSVVMTAVGSATDRKIIYLSSGEISWTTSGYVSGTYAIRMRGFYLGA